MEWEMLYVLLCNFIGYTIIISHSFSLFFSDISSLTTVSLTFISEMPLLELASLDFPQFTRAFIANIIVREKKLIILNKDIF